MPTRVDVLVTLHAGSTAAITADLLRYVRSLEGAKISYALYAHIARNEHAERNRSVLLAYRTPYLVRKRVWIGPDNKGADLRGFYSTCHAAREEGVHATVVVKLHTKRHDAWRRALIEPLLGSPRHAHALLRAARAHTTAPALYAARSCIVREPIRHPSPRGMQGIHHAAYLHDIRAAMCTAPVPDARLVDFDFVAGTICAMHPEIAAFWSRAHALPEVQRAMNDYALGSRCDPNSARILGAAVRTGRRDFMWEHALERALSLCLWWNPRWRKNIVRLGVAPHARRPLPFDHIISRYAHKGAPICTVSPRATQAASVARGNARTIVEPCLKRPIRSPR